MQAINKIGGTFTTNDELRLERLCQIVANILLTAESLNDLTMSTELNERIFQVYNSKESKPRLTLSFPKGRDYNEDL